MLNVEVTLPDWVHVVTPRGHFESPEARHPGYFGFEPFEQTAPESGPTMLWSNEDPGDRPLAI